MLYRLCFLLILLLFGKVSAQMPDSLSEDWIIHPIEAIPINMDSVRNIITFPAEIKKEEFQPGNTIIRLLVDSNGKVIDHKVTKEVHPALTRELIRCYYYLRFIPARKEGGKTVKSWVVIPYKPKY